MPKRYSAPAQDVNSICIHPAGRQPVSKYKKRKRIDFAPKRKIVPQEIFLRPVRRVALRTR